VAKISTLNTSLSVRRAIFGSDRAYFSVIVLGVYITWIILIRLVGNYAMTLSTDDLTSAWDRLIPLRPEWIWIYLLCYVYPFAPLAIVRDWHRVNRGILSFVIANVIAFVFYLLLPLAFAKPILGSSVSEQLLQIVFTIDFTPGANKLPSLHVSNAWIIYLICCRQRATKWLDPLMFVVALAITLSTMLIKQHIIIDVIAGIALAALVWILAGHLYPFLTQRDSNPRTAVQRLMRKMTTPLLIYGGLIMVIILFQVY